MQKIQLKELIEVCERRGIFQSSGKIYGGLSGVFDFGSKGAEIRRSLRNIWWREIVYGQALVYGVESAMLTSPVLHKNSGFHQAGYQDFSIYKISSDYELDGYELRVTTAQHSFANFDFIVDKESPVLPFGIAQTGKVFREESVVSDWPLRMREFEQMELQYFVPPDEAGAWQKYWLSNRIEWWVSIGIDRDCLVVTDVPPGELAHYSVRTFDIGYKMLCGTEFEIEGVANRGTYDCICHSGGSNYLEYENNGSSDENSRAKMQIMHGGTLVAPAVVESSSGLDRALMALLLDSYEPHSSRDHLVLRISPALAPVKACIYVGVDDVLIVHADAKKLRDRFAVMVAGVVELVVGGVLESLEAKHDEIGTPFIICLDRNSPFQGRANVRRLGGLYVSMSFVELIDRFEAAIV